MRTLTFLLLVIFAFSSPGAVDPAKVHLPAPPPIAEADAFPLAAPGANTVIMAMASADLGKYVFPYWGPELELSGYLKIITGISVPVVKGADADPGAAEYRIWIGGRHPKVKAAIGADLAKLDDDGFIIRAIGHDLYVAGKHPWGDQWAVHDLLERFAGCRWYLNYNWMPSGFQEKGDVEGLGVVLPRAPRVAVPKNVNVVEEPAYRARFLRHMPSHAFRIRGRDQFSHNLRNVFPTAKYGKTHPEYYPEIEGTRRVPEKNDDDMQPCVSNPDVLRIAAEAARAFFDENPDKGTFSVGMNDSDRFCECAKCLAIAPSSITDKRQRTAYAFFDFYNRLADEVARTHPGRRLGCLAYARLSEVPPGAIKLRKNVIPYLTRDSAQLFDKQEVAEFRDLVDRWSRLAEHMGIYEYLYGGGFVIPRVYNRYLLKNIREHYGVGCDGFYAEDYPSWGLDGPKYWLTCKMLWDPKQDPAALADDFYRNMFGPVAPLMKAHFDLVEEAWCTQTLESKNSNYRWLNNPAQIAILTPVVDRAWANLGEAERQATEYAAAMTDPAKKAYCAKVLERVRWFKGAFDFSRRMHLRHLAAAEMEKLAETKKGQVSLAEGLPLLAHLSAAGSTREIYDAAARLKDAVCLDPYDLFCHSFDRAGSIVRFAQAISADLVARATVDGRAASAEALTRRIGDTLRQDLTKVSGTPDPSAIALITELASRRGFLFARPVRSPPNLDGKIGPNEWGEPAFRGKFLQAFSVDTEQAEVTTVWATTDGYSLYLAFDCTGDPTNVGADVEGEDADPGSYPKMAKDDAIALTFTSEGGSFHTVRINAKGAVQGAKLAEEAAATKTATGWQAELAIPLAKVGLVTRSPRGGEAPLTRLNVARYVRGKADAKGQREVSVGTLNPIMPLGGVIGSGNHVACMVFITGVPLIIPESAR